MIRLMWMLRRVGRFDVVVLTVWRIWAERHGYENSVKVKGWLPVLDGAVALRYGRRVVRWFHDRSETMKERAYKGNGRPKLRQTISAIIVKGMKWLIKGRKTSES